MGDAMSALRAVLDRLNDIEATIERVGREASGTSPFAYRIALKSLENRRADLQEELAEITRRGSPVMADDLTARGYLSGDVNFPPGTAAG